MAAYGENLMATDRTAAIWLDMTYRSDGTRTRDLLRNRTTLYSLPKDHVGDATGIRVELARGVPRPVVAGDAGLCRPDATVR